MTAEQLQQAREAAWRQDGQPCLTADDAAAWLREITLLPFLPRPAQLAAPAPSFVEATLGRSEPHPRPDAVEAASGLLRRLLSTGDAVALRLLGSSGGAGLGTDGPDFVTTEETLPFVFALRGDREWTRGPRGRSSPLVLEVWKLLERDGALSSGEVKDRMGKHLTESAALRALGELWSELRIEPVFTPTEDTRWQLLERAHEKAMIAGSAMAQGMALSALVSVYLQGAVAATGDEIEAFLTPLASRSRVRDAVRGLHATRQLGLRNLGPREHFFVEGSLPDFAEQEPGESLPGGRGIPDNPSRKEAGEPFRAHQPLFETPSLAVPPGLLPEVPAPADVVFAADGEGESRGQFRIEALSEVETEHERTAGDGRKRYVAGRAAPSGDRKSYGARPPFGAGRPGSAGARPGGFRSGPPRPSSGRAGAGERAPGAPGERKPFFAREPWKEDRRPAAPSRPKEAAGENASERKGAPGQGFAPREGRAFDGGGKRPFSQREGGDRKPFAAREGSRPAPGGDRKPFAPRRDASASEGERDRRPFGGKPSGFKAGDGKPFRKPFEGGPGRGFAPGGARDGGTRPPRRSFAPGFPDAGQGEARPPAPQDEFAPRKPFAPRSGSESRSGAESRSDFRPGARLGARPGSNAGAGGEGRPPREGGFAPREGGERRPYTPRGASGSASGPGGASGSASGPGGARPSAYSGRSARDGGDGDRSFKPRSFSPRPGGGGTGRPSSRPDRGPDRVPGRGPAGGPDRGPARGSDRSSGGGPAGASFRPRAGGAAQPFRRSEEGSDTPRRTGRPGSGRFSPEGGASGANGGANGPGSKRPRTAPFTSSGKPRAGVGATGRPGPRSARPGAGPRKPPFGPGKAGSKPGGKGGRKRP